VAGRKAGQELPEPEYPTVILPEERVHGEVCSHVRKMCSFPCYDARNDGAGNGSHVSVFRRIIPKTGRVGPLSIGNLLLKSGRVITIGIQNFYRIRDGERLSENDRKIIS